MPEQSNYEEARAALRDCLNHQTDAPSFAWHRAFALALLAITGELRALRGAMHTQVMELSNGDILYVDEDRSIWVYRNEKWESIMEHQQ